MEHCLAGAGFSAHGIGVCVHVCDKVLPVLGKQQTALCHSDGKKTAAGGIKECCWGDTQGKTVKKTRGRSGAKRELPNNWHVHSHQLLLLNLKLEGLNSHLVI